MANDRKSVGAKTFEETINEIVHYLAFNYHWSKRDILETVYINEVEFYMKQIQKEKLNNWLMDAQVALSPQSKKPMVLINDIKKQIKRLEDKKNVKKGSVDDVAKLLRGKMKVVNNGT